MKPTYEEIKNTADVQFTALKNRALGQLFGLLGQFNSADAASKDSLKDQGLSLLAGYDEEFAGITSSLQTQLVKNDYDTSIIATYEQEYANQKLLAQGFLN